ADGLADDRATGHQGLVPGEPEVLPVDLRLGGKGDALVVGCGAVCALEVDPENDLPRSVANSQLAVHFPCVPRHGSDRRRVERDRRVALHLEEVCAAKVGVAGADARIQASGLDLRFDAGELWLLSDDDLASDFPEPAAYLRDHVPDLELDCRERPVNL